MNEPFVLFSFSALYKRFTKWLEREVHYCFGTSSFTRTKTKGGKRAKQAKTRHPTKFAHFRARGLSYAAITTTKQQSSSCPPPPPPPPPLPVRFRHSPVIASNLFTLSSLELETFLEGLPSRKEGKLSIHGAKM